MKKKKILALFMVLTLMMVFTFGCASEPAEEPAEEPDEEPAEEPEEEPAEELDYPERTIELVVPFGAGGSSDIMARGINPIMEEIMGVSVNVVNKPGGGSLDGMLYVYNQAADGYTIIQVTPSAPIIESKGGVPVNFTEEFVPIGNFQIDIMNLAILESNPNFSNFDEMIEYAKANPGDVKLGGTSPGGLDDFLVNGLADAAGVEFTFVPYNSGAEHKAAFLGGETDVYMDKLLSFLQMMDNEGVKPIATLYKERLTQVPELADVPTTVEKGVDFTQGSWRGYAVKKGTPQPIVDYLENMLKEVYESPEYREIAENEKSDLIPGYLNAEETQEMWLSELERFKKVFGE